MKGWKDLFTEPMSREYRDRILDAARTELAENVPRRNWIAQGLKIAALGTAGIGAMILGTRLVKKDPEAEHLALLDTDPELLENLDWLEDFELLDHMDELTERGES